MSSAAEIKSAIIDLDAKIQAEKDPAKKQAMTNDLAPCLRRLSQRKKLKI